ncbi:MAG: AAA family ATPase [Saprospiraceae bacterium]|nr:AAA family ATPase [Saprospiraceae bacterium]
MSTPNYIFYGTQVDAGELIRFAEHLIRTNLKAEQKNAPKTPLCIWGRHGIGKTEIVQTIAHRNDFQFQYIAPAQFEEMGDLIGMPEIHGNQTVFRAPDWVPTTEGPGILLIDDVNRADDRILRGIMQLLQNYELVSWQLPPQWQIILTANPDGGDYSVTPMDDAMLTRMMHLTLRFDVQAWAKWAEAHQIDERGIHFVLTYPELVSGQRTTARSLVQFFRAIEDLEDLSSDLELVKLLGDACLDPETVAAFIAFVQQGLTQLLSPAEILEAKNFEQEVQRKMEKTVRQKNLRLDLLSTICTRLVNYCLQHAQALDKKEINRLIQFLKLELLPNDLRLQMVRELINSEQPSLQQLMTDPEIGQLLVESF